MRENDQTPVQETPPTVEAPKVENSPEIKAAYGIPETKTEITSQMIRDLKLIDGDVYVYPNPRTDGQEYKGEIRYVDREKGYCVQLSGKRSLFVHRLEDLERIPEVGENLKFSYPNDKSHKAALTAEGTRARTRCRK